MFDLGFYVSLMGIINSAISIIQNISKKQPPSSKVTVVIHIEIKK